MRFCGILLAGGSSARYGADKLWEPVAGTPAWIRAFRSLGVPPVECCGVVAGGSRIAEFRERAAGAVFVVPGGETRTESLRRGLEAVPDGFDAVLVHDAARPFCPPALVAAVADAVRQHGAAYPALPVADTVRRADGPLPRTLDRAGLLAAQTPQGSRLDWLRQAVAGQAEGTDEAALLEAAGFESVAVPGDPANRKATFPGDLAAFTAEFRIGMGYDVHAFSEDPARPLWLGGVLVPGETGLHGHSDADPVLHAVTDALLGAAGEGDIGELFPDTDPQWKDARSATFARAAADLLRARNWSIVNVDVTVVAEKPRIAPFREAMRAAIESALGIGPGQASIKATTNEKLGALGRAEGVAAMAVVSICRHAPNQDEPCKS